MVVAVMRPPMLDDTYRVKGVVRPVGGGLMVTCSRATPTPSALCHNWQSGTITSISDKTVNKPTLYTQPWQQTDIESAPHPHWMQHLWQVMDTLQLPVQRTVHRGPWLAATFIHASS